MRNAFRSLVFLFLPLAALSAARRPERLGFDPRKEPARAASAYIAPENSILFRMRYPDGTYREFDRNFARPDVLHSGGGWKGRIKGERVVVRTGPDVEGGPAVFIFEKGTLVSFAQSGVTNRFPLGSVRESAGSLPPYYFGFEDGSSADADKSGQAAKPAPKKMDRQVEALIKGKWKKSGRLRWPFSNPNENGCLYASLALLSVFLFFSERKVLRIAGGVLFLAASAALTATASRGSFLALAVGVFPVAAFHFRKLVRSRQVWLLAGVVLAVAAVWFLTHDARLLTRGFRGASSWSNEVRLNMWKAVPQMMAESPGGWYFAHVGRAFLDWYQDLGELSMPGSLMNEHLTRLAAYDWSGRFAYLLAWFFGLGLLLLGALRTRNAVALGVWLLFAVAGWFNPIFVNVWLWAVPVGAAVVFLCQGQWRNWTLKNTAVLFGLAALAAVGVLGAVYVVGSARKPARGYPIRAEGERVYVKGRNPLCWIVDDGKALGGMMACKDVRGYYVFRPEAPSVGYVRSVKALPDVKIHRLLLAGDAGHAWMQELSKKMAAGGETAQRALQKLPEEIVFISPPFPPSALPDGLLKSCKVRLVIGEFNARYEDEYRTPPPWVTVVPAMELYLVGWMEYAVGNR